MGRANYRVFLRRYCVWLNRLERQGDKFKKVTAAIVNHHATDQKIAQLRQGRAIRVANAHKRTVMKKGPMKTKKGPMKKGAPSMKKQPKTTKKGSMKKAKISRLALRRKG